MSQKTQLKFLRQNFPEALKEEFREVTPREMFRCKVCGGPMFLSIGQIAACHKACRPRWRKMIKEARRFEQDARSTVNTTEKEAEPQTDPSPEKGAEGARPDEG